MMFLLAFMVRILVKPSRAIFMKLLTKKFLTFLDAELEKGDEISSALNKAIEESDASVVIFSKHYASSKWCLNELVKILECKRDQRQIVIRVFYDIDVGNPQKSMEYFNQS